MSGRLFSVSMWLWMAIGLFLFGVAVIYFDPEHGGIVGFLLFYLGIFSVIGSFFSILFRWLRKKNYDEFLWLHFRQGILLSGFLTILLIMQQERVLVWWTGLLVLSLVLLVELFFLHRGREHL